MALFDGPKGFSLFMRMIVAIEKIAEMTQPKEIVKEVAVEVITEVIKEVEVERLVVDEKQQAELDALTSDYELLQTSLRDVNIKYKETLVMLDAAKAQIPQDPSMPKPLGPQHQGYKK
tara:strand:+ start:303 stop:656 length:354 start_codon:yes stop_codon:yes gene_type:complete